MKYVEGSVRPIPENTSYPGRDSGGECRNYGSQTLLFKDKYEKLAKGSIVLFDRCLIAVLHRNMIWHDTT